MILDPEMAATHVHVVIKGHVQHVEAGEVVSVYGPDDFYGARAAMAGRTSSVLTALDEVIAYLLPQATLQALIASNSRFSALLFADMSRRLSAVAEGNKSREFLSLMMVQVRDAFIRKPFFVDGGTDLVSLCAQLAERGLTNALVRDTGPDGLPRVGMFTTTDLRDALLRPVPPAQLAVREVARFDLISRHARDRAVRRPAGHDPPPRAPRAGARWRHHPRRAEPARPDELHLQPLAHHRLAGGAGQHGGRAADRGTTDRRPDPIAAQRGGVKIDVISTLVSELNSQIFARLWQLIAPPDLVAHSCLLVMGSEGRGEQILKTDQDNALIVADGFDCGELPAVAERFNQALAGCGYPPCPGQIMLTNPLWRQPLAGFKSTIADWILGSDPDAPMHLAIFMDARVVAGDAGLLHAAREHMRGLFNGSDALLARFAAAVEQFSEPGTWWDRLTTLRGREEQAFDLKKLGTFPVVHGIRALALQNGIDALGTSERIHQLASRHQLEAPLARDLGDALRFLMGLKLQNNLRQQQLGEAVHNSVKLSDLGTLERDLLKDSLAIIKRFKQHLRSHFRLDAL